MTDKDTYTHDGRYIPRVGYECELMQPYDPSDDEERPITDEMLIAWVANRRVMHWRDQRRVVKELLGARADLDDWRKGRLRW